MYCQNCNAVLKDGVRFCTECGSPVKTPAFAKAVEKKRSVPLAALLFAAFAIGPFLQNAVSTSRYLWNLGSSDIQYTFYNLTIFFSALLLFAAALFLIISAVREFPNGKRPVLGGIALLLVSFAFGFSMLNYLTVGIHLRWPTVAYMICYAVSADLFLVAAILAFINKRFAVLGLIGAIVYIALQLLMMIYNLFMRSRMPGYPVIEIVTTEILPYLLRISFGIALMIFSLKCRPQKGVKGTVLLTHY